MLKVIELFAGIGAQRKALQKAKIEHEVIAISEIDKYAIQSYNAIHGETPNLGDITKIEKIPKADLWTYSFPCTDISLAGRMSGFENTVALTHHFYGKFKDYYPYQLMMERYLNTY